MKRHQINFRVCARMHMLVIVMCVLFPGNLGDPDYCPQGHGIIMEFFDDHGKPENEVYLGSLQISGHQASPKFLLETIYQDNSNKEYWMKFMLVIKAPTTGDHTFHLGCNGNCVLYLNEMKYVNTANERLKVSSTTKTSVTINLAAGKCYQIQALGQKEKENELLLIKLGVTLPDATEYWPLDIRTSQGFVVNEPWSFDTNFPFGYNPYLLKSYSRIWDYLDDQSLNVNGRYLNTKTGCTPSDDTGPCVDHSTGTASGGYMVLESSYNSPLYVGSARSIYRINGGFNCVRFAYHMHGSGMGKLEVFNAYTTSHPWIWISRWKVAGNQNDEWLQAEASVGNGANEFLLIFAFFKGEDWHSDIAIDDVLVTYDANCAVIPAKAADPVTCRLPCQSGTTCNDVTAKCDCGTQEFVGGDDCHNTLQHSIYKEAYTYWPFDQYNRMKELKRGQSAVGSCSGLIKSPINAHGIYISGNVVTLGDFQGTCLTDPSLCTTGLTISFWFGYIPNSADSNHVKTVLGNSNDISLDRGILVTIDQENNVLTVLIIDSSSTCKYETPAEPEIWFHIVILWDSVLKSLEVFVNSFPADILKYECTAQGSASSPAVTSLNLGASSGHVFCFDDMAIWMRKLELGEIEMIYKVLTENRTIIKLVLKIENEPFVNEYYNNEIQEYQDMKQKIHDEFARIYDSERYIGIKALTLKPGSLKVTVDVILNVPTMKEVLSLDDALKNVKTFLGNPVITETFKLVGAYGWLSGFNVVVLNYTAVGISFGFLQDNVDSKLSLQGYEVLYKEISSPEFIPVYFPGRRPVTELDGLIPLKTYQFRAGARSIGGMGYYCDPRDVTLPEGVPSAPPGNFTGNFSGSMSILIEWAEIPVVHQNGLLLGYEVIWWQSDLGNTTGTVETIDNVTVLFLDIPGLIPYTYYSVRILGFTSTGSGPWSEVIVIRTDEDVPSHPPTNITYQNKTGDVSIYIEWSQVPLEHHRGVILGYSVHYRAVSDGDSSAYVVEIVNNPNITNITIENLSRNEIYDVQLAAFTSKGDGNLSTPVFIETCVCPKIMTTNWYDLPPYVISSPHGDPEGIFPALINLTVSSCCTDCGHGVSEINFLFDSVGNASEKQDEETVKMNTLNAELSFPLFGDEKAQETTQKFVGIITTPGYTMLMVENLGALVAKTTSTGVFQIWTMMLFCFLVALLAGMVLWFCDTWSNEQEFPKSFIRGSGEGLWWAFVTMTTVGYGDRSPRSIPARIFSIVWMLMGLVLFSLLMGSITTLLITTVSVTSAPSARGKELAVKENSFAQKYTMKKGLKTKAGATYKTYKDVSKAVKDFSVNTVLIDTYALGYNHKLFESIPDIKVANSFDVGEHFGVFLSVPGGFLQECFIKTIEIGLTDVMDQIQTNTKPFSPKKVQEVEVAPEEGVQEEEEEPSLIDPTVPIFAQTVFICLGWLVIASCVGLFWQCKLRGEKSTSEPRPGDLLRKELEPLVVEFYESFLEKVSDLKKAHNEERILVLKRMKAELCVERQPWFRNQNRRRSFTAPWHDNVSSNASIETTDIDESSF